MNLQSKKYFLETKTKYSSKYFKKNDFSLFCLFHVEMKMKLVNLLWFQHGSLHVKSLEATND